MVVPRFIYQGKELRDVRLTFADGQLTAMEGPAGSEAKKARQAGIPAHEQAGCPFRCAPSAPCQGV